MAKSLVHECADMIRCHTDRADCLLISASFKMRDCNIDFEIFVPHSDECDFGSGATDFPLPGIVPKGSGFHPASYPLVTGAKTVGV
jgi:hypothetical protein